jgi:hypothetical protein
VASKDAFLMFFFSFIYEALCSRRDDAIESDIGPYLAYFNDFASWDSDELNKLKGANKL